MKWITLFCLLASESAFGGPDLYYCGHSQNKYHFSLEYYGDIVENGEFLVSKLLIDIKKNHRTVNTINSCIFLYRPYHWEHDRIECPQDTKSLLSGAVYKRSKNPYGSSGGTEDMICVKGCTNKIPKVFKSTFDVNDC